MLNAKGLQYELIPVDLKAGGHKNPAFLEKNPLGQVPVLEFTDSFTGKVHRLTQSVAIHEFLECLAPKKRSLLPADPLERVAATEMVEIINSGIQPLQNAPMVNKIERGSEGKIRAEEFAQEHIIRGLKALEHLVAKRKESGSAYGPYCMGNFSPTIVDVFLVPQLYNARRFGLTVEKEFPVLAAVEAVCAKHPWFDRAHASNQVDAET